jgi:phospholipase/carboxylesterase
VALPGGAGHGRDFLWTWMREARARSYVLLAPSAVAGTWGELEERGLLEIVAWIGARYRIDPRRVLLTGLSDGATFTLVYGLAHPEVFRALAPLCGVLHPLNLANGNVARARGLPIYLVHGARDFLFPVVYARMARDVLTSAGADLTYRELPELSHTYPRSENAAILDWFERHAGAAP